MEIKEHLKAGLFGTDKSTVKEITDGAKTILGAIHFSEEELQAIMIIVRMVLKAMGIQGLSMIVDLLMTMQQSLAAEKAGAAAAQSNVAVATK